MKLLELELTGFKPLSLSNINYFRWTPAQPWQLILGTNGSGKSSISRAATPTTTDRNEFREGGCKKSRWLSIDNVLFELESHYGKKPHHSFIRDGKELNDGGTAMVQNQLVEQHMGYTAHLHRILTQDIRFTSMSKSQRENMLIDISGVNFDFALATYDKLKQALRDAVGASKHLSVKYSDLCAQLDSMGDMEELAMRLKEEEETVTSLLPLTNLSLNGINPIETKLANNQRELEAILPKAQQLRKQILNYEEEQIIFPQQFSSFEEFKANIASAKEKLEAVDGDIEVVQKELAELSDVMARLEECPDTIDASQLDAQIKALTEKLESWSSSIIGVYTNYTDATNSLKLLIGNFASVADHIPTSLDFFSQEEVKTITDATAAAKTRVAEIKQKLDRAETIHHHAVLAKQSDTVCPNCDTRILGNDSMSDEKMAQLEANIQNGRNALDEAEKTLEARVAEQDKVDLYMANRTRVTGLLGQYPMFSKIWTEIGKADDILRAPHVLMQAFSDELDGLAKENEKLRLERELEKMKEYQYLIKLSETDNAEGRFTELTKRYDEMIVQKVNWGNTVRVYGKLEQMFSALTSYKNQMDKLVEERDRLFHEWVDNEATLEITNKVKEMQSRLGTMRNSLTRWEDLEKRRQFLASENEQLAQRKKAFDRLVKAISPQHGFIGRQLRESLNQFCASVNSILGEIWEHELLISVPKDEKKLSFNFTMHVDGDERPDIKVGSTGEQDVINLAATLVIMAQKELAGYPLFMDEIGSSFDYAHRANLLAFIRKLISTGAISQLIMISHFASEYGGIANCDVIAMNTNNVQIHGEYNTVVEMS
ncbi:hypothetical protein [Vibrio phage vB_VmeM-Yong XC32]|nr:hypothetical protein [Vibrio phage vB_VmeM-Yong XC31]QAX96468.1 hypothetical protein [Vibrio phage vB_VmeM-Yong XC32]QAX96785.1 hypothetical protein [Vibrio phage vB_VmeM-Yong MS31]QAX97104.1 hypothetical protein [Vibrio phage vB_VmeM-Yong MS32]